NASHRTEDLAAGSGCKLLPMSCSSRCSVLRVIQAPVSAQLGLQRSEPASRRIGQEYPPSFEKTISCSRIRLTPRHTALAMRDIATSTVDSKAAGLRNEDQRGRLGCRWHARP